MEEVQKYECLYSKQSKEYKDNHKKINSWEAIAKVFNSSGREVETKFKNTRTAYGRYLKKVKSTGSGSGIKDLPPPSEFKSLEWLKKHISTRQTFINLKTVAAETVDRSYDPDEAEDLEQSSNVLSADESVFNQSNESSDAESFSLVQSASEQMSTGCTSKRLKPIPKTQACAAKEPGAITASLLIPRI